MWQDDCTHDDLCETLDEHCQKIGESARIKAWMDAMWKYPTWKFLAAFGGPPPRELPVQHHAFFHAVKIAEQSGTDPNLRVKLYRSFGAHRLAMFEFYSDNTEKLPAWVLDKDGDIK